MLIIELGYRRLLVLGPSALRGVALRRMDFGVRGSPDSSLTTCIRFHSRCHR